jgi:hypothetical protein
MALNGAQIAKRWLQGVSSTAAQEKYKEGVDAVTVHPGQLAAAQADKMKANVVAAIESNLWQTRVQKGTLGDWKTRTKAKGASRLSTGATASLDKYTEAANKMAPVWEDIKITAQGMPSNTMEEKLAKVRMSIEKQKAAVGKTY